MAASIRKMTLVYLVLLPCFITSVQGGTRYAVAFPGIAEQEETDGASVTYVVLVTNPTSSSANVSRSTVDSTDYTMVGAHTAQEFTFYQRDSLNGSELANKSVIFESDTPDLVLQGFIKVPTEITEGFLGLPESKLDNEYTVTSFCEMGGYCQLLIVPIEPGNTTVHVELPDNVDDIIFCIGTAYFRCYRDTTLNLALYDVVQFETPYDLTGTNITSDKKVAVFTANRKMTIEGVTSNLVEQLPPRSLWGRRYGTTNLGSNSYGDILKISSSAADNKVTMLGYHSFTMTGGTAVLRRLDAGMSTFITATYPIQVLQIAGVTYATTGDTVAPGMTVLPAVENHALSYYRNCGPTGSETMTFNWLGKSSVTTYPIKYTDYGTDVDAHSPSNPFQKSEKFGGVLKCGTSALMPMGLAAPVDIATNPNIPMTVGDGIDNDNDGSIDEDACIQGKKVTISSVFTSGGIQVHTENIEDAQVVTLQIKSCGLGLVTLQKASGDRLRLQITKKGDLEWFLCNGINAVCDKQTPVSMTAQGTCAADVSFYWFRFEPSGTMCVGTGPLPDTDCTSGSPAPHIVHDAAGDTFRTIALSALLTEAIYVLDIMRSDCAAVTSDWKCEDQAPDCDIYGSAFCSRNEYDEWTQLYCRKHCDKCTPDAYGRRFLVAIPFASATSAIIAVAPVTEQDAIGVSYPGAIVARAGIESGETAYYVIPTASMAVPLFITADKDVAVSVTYHPGDKISSYTVLPYDAVGTEYMAITNCVSETCSCIIVPRDVDTTVKVYTAVTLEQSSGGDIVNADSVSVSYGQTRTVYIASGELLGTVFIADNPVYIYCGNNGGGLYVHFNQMLPVNSWGKAFVTPPLGDDVANRPYEGKLRILANVDNTLVTIAGDFDAVHPLYKRGDHVDQDIDVGTVYTITATYPVAIGLFLYDVTEADPGTASSFNLIPPTEQFLFEKQVTQVPRGALNHNDFTGNSFLHSSHTTYLVDSNGAPISLPEGAVTANFKTSDSPYAVASIGLSVVYSSSNEWFVVPGGQKVRKLPVEQTCVVTTGTAGDNLDNDCDGIADEDVCYTGYGVTKEDTDFDAGYGEDCLCEVTDGEQLTKPEEPQCIKVVEKPGICLAVFEFCKCEWLDRQKEREKMTEAERQADDAAESAKIQAELTVDTSELSSTTAKKASANDERQSAASIGYVGICLFVVVFGSIIVMDIASLVRDFRIMKTNLMDGVRRAKAAIRGR